MFTEHLTIFSTREEVGLPAGDCKTSHNRDVSREGDLELAAGQIPDLDHSVCCSRCKPLISRLNSTATHLELILKQHCKSS